MTYFVNSFLRSEKSVNGVIIYLSINFFKVVAKCLLTKFPIYKLTGERNRVVDHDC